MLGIPASLGREFPHSYTTKKRTTFRISTRDIRGSRKQPDPLITPYSGDGKQGVGTSAP
jgi:hypothetical protein